MSRSPIPMAARTGSQPRAWVCLRGLLLAASSMLWLSLALAGEPQHGLALGTTVKYPAGFAHYAYADPQAVKDGVLTLASPGSFDKLNPFSLKGRAPLLLSALVFESLTRTGCCLANKEAKRSAACCPRWSCSWAERINAWRRAWAC